MFKIENFDKDICQLPSRLRTIHFLLPYLRWKFAEDYV